MQARLPLPGRALSLALSLVAASLAAGCGSAHLNGNGAADISAASATLRVNQHLQVTPTQLLTRQIFYVQLGSFDTHNGQAQVHAQFLTQSSAATSVELYAGTLAKWFGLSDGQIREVFPNFNNFGSNPYLGFLG